MFETISVEDIKKIALIAGDAIMEIYKEDFQVEYKDDNSPLTKADLKANEIICTSLQKQYPKIPIISEENKQIEYSIRKDWEYYWCIDPIDGTKEFIKKNGEFTVNIALIYKDTPILGVVYAPCLDEIYSAKKGCGAFKNGIKLPIKINSKPDEVLKVVVSKSHFSKETQEYIDKLDTKKIVQISKGSSLKLCMVAEGTADIYPKLGFTYEWDTAAGHAIVLEAGKDVVQFDTNSSLVYNKENLLNPWFLVR